MLGNDSRTRRRLNEILSPQFLLNYPLSFAKVFKRLFPCSMFAGGKRKEGRFERLTNGLGKGEGEGGVDGCVPSLYLSIAINLRASVFY